LRGKVIDEAVYKSIFVRLRAVSSNLFLFIIFIENTSSRLINSKYQKLSWLRRAY